MTHNEIYFFCSKYLHWIKRITFVTMGSIWLMKENIWKQMTNHRDLQCSNETEKRRESWKTRIGTRSNTIWAVHVWKEWVEIRNSSAEGRSATGLWRENMMWTLRIIQFYHVLATRPILAKFPNITCTINL